MHFMFGINKVISKFPEKFFFAFVSRQQYSNIKEFETNNLYFLGEEEQIMFF